MRVCSTNLLWLCILIVTSCWSHIIRAVPPPSTQAVQINSPIAPQASQDQNTSIFCEIASIYENVCKFICDGFAEWQSLARKAMEYCDGSFECISKDMYLQQRQCGMLCEETKAWVQSFKKGIIRGESTADLINECVDISLKYLSKDYDIHWAFVGELEGIFVWKCKAVLSDIKGANRWPCIKAKSVIDAPPAKVADLLYDSSRIHLTNKYSQGRTDVKKIGEKTKIVWNRTKIPFTVRPYDFCSLIHVVKAEEKDSYMIVTKSTEHHLVPKHPDYTRSEIFLGVNIIEPLESDPRKSEITSINHVRYVGIPPFVATRNFFTGTTNYFKQLKTAARDL